MMHFDFKIHVDATMHTEQQAVDFTRTLKSHVSMIGIRIDNIHDAVFNKGKKFISFEADAHSDTYDPTYIASRIIDLFGYKTRDCADFAEINIRVNGAHNKPATYKVYKIDMTAEYASKWDIDYLATEFINGVKETLSYMENSHEYLDEVLAHKFEANRYGNDNWRYVPEENYDIMVGYRGTVPKDEEKCSLPLKYAFTPV
jgi:hypothetical protein